MPDLAGRLRASDADVCSREYVKGKVRLLMVINSGAERPKRRRNIRRQFARFQECFSGKARAVFFVGRPRNGTLERRLEKEAAAYGDVVLTDVWQPLTRKSHFLSVRAVSALNWARANCRQAQFVLKTSDTVNVNVPAVMKLVRDSHYMTNTMWMFEKM